MAKARNKRKKQVNAVVDRFVRPTEQREAVNDFQSAGAAVRVIPVIDTLLRLQKLTQAEYDALKHYRDQAHRAEDDLAQSSPLAPERIMGGVSSGSAGGTIPCVLLATPAIIECGRLERELGSLRGLARAVAVDDWTLTRWAISQSGGVEKHRAGRTVEIAPRDPRAVDVAALELRFAAGRIRQ